MDHPDYMINHIEFENDSWRKLHYVKRIDFAPRITVIAGLNGIGKSTLLGLCANCLGFTGKSGVPGDDINSYFGSKFQANFDEIFALTEEDLNQKGRSIIYIKKKDGSPIIKGCNVSKAKEKTNNDTKKPRLRVVARTMREDNGTWKNVGSEEGAAAKVPFPVLYLGMSRVWPIGESDEKDREVKNKLMDCKEDIEYIHELTKNIISVDYSQKRGIEEVSVSGISRKKHNSLQPKWTFPTLAISLGQGAVGTIVTALASFKMLKRKLGDEYPGGLLVIDELDAGLYPAAQIDLVKVLAKEARPLKLQILATSHSPVILKAVNKLKEEAIENPQDGIVFLSDSIHPKCEDKTFQEIEKELYLEKTEEKRERRSVYIYTEDTEASDLLSIITNKIRKPLKSKQYNICSLSLGNNQLKQLVNNRKLPHFSKESVSVLDGDVRLKQTKDNIANLPTMQNAERSPEEEFSFYVDFLINRDSDDAVSNLEKMSYSSDYLQRNVTRNRPSEDKRNRETMKIWYNNIDKKIRKDIWKCWVEENKEACYHFLEELKKKIERIQKINEMESR